MYRTSDEVYVNLIYGKTNISNVNRQMHRYFKKKDVNKWLMFAEAKIKYLMDNDLNE